MNENLSETRDRVEPTTVIAPAEIQELLARITEQSIEAIPAHEARTLEGLAVETGISVSRLSAALSDLRSPQKRRRIPTLALIAAGLAMIGAGWWLKPKPAPAPSIFASQMENLKTNFPAADLDGLVSLSRVTFGPDGGMALVDQSFVPTEPVPEGLSLTIEMAGVMWGTGDPRAKVLERPLQPEAVKKLKQTAAELYEYAIQESEKRRLVAGRQLKRRVFSITSYMYYGATSTQLDIPVAKETDPKKLPILIDRAADELVQSIQKQLRQQAEFRRMNGP